MEKKILLGFICVILIALVACTNSNNELQSLNELSSSPTSKEKINIHLWDYYRTDPESSALDDLINKYMKTHPEVVIQRTSIPLADIVNMLLLGSATGNLPDILLLVGANHQMFAAAGMLADISEEVETWGQEGQYLPEVWASSEYHGKRFGIPMGVSNAGLYYNADLLAEANIAPPKDWNELKAAAIKLTKPGVHGFQATAVRNDQAIYSFLPFFWQSGSKIETFDSPGTIEAVTLWKEMVDNGSMSKEILNQGFLGTSAEFLSGNIAMIVNGTWLVNVLEKEATFNWGVVPMPSYKEEATVLGDENWAITSTSQHKEIAWDFIQFSQQEEILKDYLLGVGRLPAKINMLQKDEWQDNEHLKVFADSLAFAKPKPFGPKYPEISKVIQKMLQQVISGQKTPEEAVKEANEKIEPLLVNEHNT